MLKTEISLCFDGTTMVQCGLNLKLMKVQHFTSAYQLNDLTMLHLYLFLSLILTKPYITKPTATDMIIPRSIPTTIVAVPVNNVSKNPIIIIVPTHLLIIL